MPEEPDFDLAVVHRYFSADCFNKTWEFIDNPHLSPDEELVMLQTAMTSLWHWSQRKDATAKNFSIGNWQVSRVFALLGQADNARRYAEVSLKMAEGGDPFYIAFGYEALARAEMTAGNKEKMQEYLNTAFALAEKVEDEENKQALLGDLGNIK
jgi:hypothetical protein